MLKQCLVFVPVLCALILHGCIGTAIFSPGDNKPGGDPADGPSLDSVPIKPPKTSLIRRANMQKDLEKDHLEAQGFIKEQSSQNAQETGKDSTSLQ